MERSAGPSRSNVIVSLVVAAAFVLVLVSGAAATFYTDYLWFADLGQASVFWTKLLSRAATGLAFAAVFFAVVFVNVRIARRMAPKAVLFSAGPTERLEAQLAQIRRQLSPVFDWLLLAGSLFFAFAWGAGMASDWPVFQLALNAVPSGLKDAHFGRDVSFFMFTLPALRLIADWVLSMLVFTLVATTVVHVLDGAIRPWARLRGFEPHVKAHLSVLAGLIVASKAFDYWLRIYELDFSGRGQVRGASYTDVHAQLPAYWILIGVALVSGLVLLVNIRFKGWRLPAVALGFWIAASFLIGSVYPGLVQAFRVAPNELAAEEPYIKRNIMATREAFDLEKIESRPFAAEQTLTSTDIAENAPTIDNVRLWDPNVVVQTYKQLQEIRLYYDFNDVDIDRYRITKSSGKPTVDEVLVSAREMNVEQLTETAKTFVNQHLVYTHGYGAVVSPVNQSDENGQPTFIVKDIPPKSTTSLKITRPGIYFGEESFNFVVARSGIKEFDYPLGEENARTSYAGKTGVEVGGPLRRLAFALRFGAPEFIFSSYVTPTSKVLYNRSITERVKRLAPWLRLDRDPYMAIIDGKLVWILDGYTTSPYYPYAQEAEPGLTYMRNSVKATVDAYDGTTTLYAFDTKDPVLQTWRQVFPGLVVDASKMPSDVREHLRYPEDLFRVQAEVYKTYHMTDPQVFYNKEDQWGIPGESAGEEMAPFYVLMRLPDEKTEQFLLMLPFTPKGKQNMIGWMAAKSDPGSYGERLVYKFPKQRLILGPEQVNARVNQDPTISQQLSLWNQRGSSVRFGNLLVIPIKDSIVFIEPLYLQAEQTAIPQLTRVIVVSPQKVAMEADLATALAKVFGAPPPAPATKVPGGPAAPGAKPTPPSPRAPTANAQRAQDLYERALKAQREGDWAEYGDLIEQLGTVLADLAEESGTTTPTP